MDLWNAITPTVLALMALAIAAIGFVVMLDRWKGHVSWVEPIEARLGDLRSHTQVVMRFGIGATLMLAWQSGTLFAPELATDSAWIPWLEFILALLLIVRRAVRIVGVGIICLFGVGLGRFGAFHMMDYLMFAGVGYYFAVCYSVFERRQQTALVVLYATLGLSLCWLALEKLIYPTWSIHVLSEHPQLTMGFDPMFFLTGCAFVEFSLGFMLLLRLRHRLLGLVVTVIFMTTSLIFGRAELIGHLPIHATLITLMITGIPDATMTPLTFLHRLWLKVAFSMAAYPILFGLLLGIYARAAEDLYRNSVHGVGHSRAGIEFEGQGNIPSVSLKIHPDTQGGWNLEVMTENFRFTPEAAGNSRLHQDSVPFHILGTPENQGDSRTPRQGHGHLYINGEQVSRIYGRWFYIGELRPGTYDIKVVLSGNNHSEFLYRGVPIAATVRLDVGVKRARGG